MLIRISTTRAVIPRTGEGIAFVHGEIQPKISAMDGNRGFAMAVDRSSGRYLGIAAWTDAEALKAGEDRAPGLIADVAERLDGSSPTVELFDLAVAHLVKPVRVGYWGRLVRAEVPVHEGQQGPCSRTRRVARRRRSHAEDRLDLRAGGRHRGDGTTVLVSRQPGGELAA